MKTLTEEHTEIQDLARRVGEALGDGWRLRDFEDSFSRYLGVHNPQRAQQTNGDSELDQKSNPQPGALVADRKSGLTTETDRNVADVADICTSATYWAGWNRLGTGRSR